MQAVDNPSALPKSRIFAGLRWRGKRIPYPVSAVRGDTFPLTWARDGEIYASSGDPLWEMGPDGPRAQPQWDLSARNPHMHGLDVERFTGLPPGHRIEKINEMPDYTGGGGDGTKPRGMLAVDGALYLAVQNLLGRKPPAHGEAGQHGSDAFIVCSRDEGKTWLPAIEEWKRRGPMFPGARFGGPSFVQYGRDPAVAPDGLVYAVSADQWDNGTDLRLGRVRPDAILEAKAWEWAAAAGRGGVPAWTGKLEESVPVLSMDRHVSLPEMVYLAHTGRYLLFTWRLHRDFCPDGGSELIVLEAPRPWGPFALVHYEPQWEETEVNPYCPRLPLKWFDASDNSGWLLFSGSWLEFSPHYRAHVRAFRLEPRRD